MATSVIIAGSTGGVSSIAASTTAWLPAATASALSMGLETYVGSRWQTTGTLSKLTVNVLTNDRGASTVRLRKNTANGNGLVSIGASLTGVFADASGSDAIAASDLVAYQLTTGAGGTTFTYNSVASTFTATANTVVRFQCTRDGGFMTAAGTRALSGEQANVGVQDDSRIQTDGTLKGLVAFTTFNNRTGATSIGITVNGAASAVVASAPAATSGTFTDASNTAAVVASDLVRFAYTSGTSGSIAIENISVDFETTGRNSQLIAHAIPSAITAGAVGYGTPAGTLFGLHTVTSEAASQVAFPDAGSIVSLSVYASSSTTSAASTVTVRKAGVDSDVAVTVPLNTTGWFSDTGSLSISASDLVSLGFVVGAGTGSITFRDASLGWLAPANTKTGSHVLGVDGTVTTTRTGLINLDNVTRSVAGAGVQFIGGALGMIEQATPPTAKANTALIYADDSGGKTRLMVLFSTGAAIQLSIEV